MKLSPPTPFMWGLTTASTPAIVIAASTAFPPRFSTSMPAADASTWSDVTAASMPPTSGRMDGSCAAAGTTAITENDKSAATRAAVGTPNMAIDVRCSALAAASPTARPARPCDQLHGPWRRDSVARPRRPAGSRRRPAVCRYPQREKVRSARRSCTAASASRAEPRAGPWWVRRPRAPSCVRSSSAGEPGNNDAV